MEVSARVTFNKRVKSMKCVFWILNSSKKISNHFHVSFVRGKVKTITTFFNKRLLL